MDLPSDLGPMPEDKYHHTSHGWGPSSANNEYEPVAEPVPQCQQLKISTLRKFDKFMRKYRRGTFTCSSKSTYSFNKDIDEMSEEQDQDSEQGEDDLASKTGAEEDIGDVYDLDEPVDGEHDIDPALATDRDRDFYLQLAPVDEYDGHDSCHSGTLHPNHELESLTSDGCNFKPLQHDGRLVSAFFCPTNNLRQITNMRAKKSSLKTVGTLNRKNLRFFQQTFMEETPRSPILIDDMSQIDNEDSMGFVD